MKLEESSAAAEAELATARDQYEAEREGLGQEFVDAMERLMARIVERPLQFTQVRRSRARRALGKRFPYKVVFFVFPDRVRIVAVAHQHREPGYWKRRT